MIGFMWALLGCLWCVFGLFDPNPERRQWDILYGYTCFGLDLLNEIKNKLKEKNRG